MLYLIRGGATHAQRIKLMPTTLNHSYAGVKHLHYEIQGVMEATASAT
jgi:hypothetical protein